MEDIICEIRNHLLKDEQDGLKKCALKLKKNYNPHEIMDALACKLFVDESSSSSQETILAVDALNVIGFLVTADTPLYLKSASRAIKEQAVRLANTSSMEIEMKVSPQLTQVMIHQMAVAHDVETSANATQAIVACCLKMGPTYTSSAMKDGIVPQWKHALTITNRTEASTMAVRCASAVVDIILQVEGIDESSFVAAQTSGALDLFVQALEKSQEDPLFVMSFLDLLETMVIKTDPVQHLERTRWLLSDTVLKSVLQMAGGSSSSSSIEVDQTYNEPDPILGGPALKVVGVLCQLGLQHSQEALHLWKYFHSALHNFVTYSSGEVDRLALIDAISSFSTSSSEALQKVLSDPVTRNAWLSLGVAQPKLKSAILVSIAKVLQQISGNNKNKDGMQLIASLGQTNDSIDVPDLLLTLARSPLVEIRLGSYALLEAVAQLPTGGQMLFNHGGFYEFLIDREKEKTTEGKEAKFAVVKALCDSPVKQLLADEIVKNLEKYLKQGPYYVKALSWDVAAEETA